MTQLFITTAKEGLSVELLKQFPLSGSLFIVNTGVKGLGGITLKDDT
jgi:sugar lactone lactonase YvrE